MKIAIIGQSNFAVDVFQKLLEKKYDIVGVFTIPDVNGKEDPLAQAAKKNNVPVFKFPRWRLKGAVIADVLAQYKSVGAELNVMPFCSQFIPMEVITAPKFKSIIYHPSILPKHRGASAINWTLIDGDAEAGYSVFWADDGLDTGPILLQSTCKVDINDTVDSLYLRFLYPDGIRGVVESVDMIANGTAPSIVQKEEGASYDPMLKPGSEHAIVNWDTRQTALQIHNFIRGLDKVPGASCTINDINVRLYGSELWQGALPASLRAVTIKGLNDNDKSKRQSFIHSNGLIIEGTDAKFVNVKQIHLVEEKKLIPAVKFGDTSAGGNSADSMELTADEKEMKNALITIWEGILSMKGGINDDTDFFESGAGSMDVTRLVEEIRGKCGGAVLSPDDVYMATKFGDLYMAVVEKRREQQDDSADAGGKKKKSGKTCNYDAVKMNVNDMDISFPHQLFIDNKFVDSRSGKTFKTINPIDESVICEISLGGAEDVDIAVNAAKKAFDSGEWTKMSARDRAKLLFRLADLMEEDKEELATIETLDSGAVYTLALKTHIGMSIDTFRYFAGWCDKIEGSVIPISHARPAKNLTMTRREPIGVCGIITPWNYPLMMLAWKCAACLATGNTLVLKPAQVTPLTSLKFCELIVRAGFPPGVVNLIPGSGAIVGQAMADHSLIRKLGFTGSTPVGKTIMQSCGASNGKKVSLELGGKSPLIICADCDEDKAIKAALGAVFFNKGENCIAAGRIFVEESIHDNFVQRVVEEVKKMKIGDPFDRSTDHGPQNHLRHLNKLLEYCQRGVKEGAKLVLGGGRVPDLSGLFMQPTVFTDVTDNMFIAKEESFGPVMIISKFTSIPEVVERANATEYGLAAGVFTKDINKALRLSDAIEAGTVFVNTYNKTDVAVPFGGFKQSGFGKDLGQEALKEYLKVKAVTIEY